MGLVIPVENSVIRQDIVLVQCLDDTTEILCQSNIIVTGGLDLLQEDDFSLGGATEELQNLAPFSNSTQDLGFDLVSTAHQIDSVHHGLPDDRDHISFGQAGLLHVALDEAGDFSIRGIALQELGQVGQKRALHGILLVSTVIVNQLLHVLGFKMTDKTVFITLVGREELNDTRVQTFAGQDTTQLLDVLLIQDSAEDSGGEVEGMAILDEVVLQKHLQDRGGDELVADEETSGLGQFGVFLGLPLVDKLQDVLKCLSKDSLQVFVTTDQFVEDLDILFNHGGIIFCCKKAERASLSIIVNNSSRFYFEKKTLGQSTALPSFFYTYLRYHQ